MTKNEIRLKYSGLIVFAAQILSVATGVIFTLLLTRNMTKDDYGVWSNIFDLMGYFMILGGLFPFWATRFVARGKEGAVKTGLFANILVALVSVAIYISLVPTIMNEFNVAAKYMIIYIVASAQVINLHLIGMLESCLRAKKPQAIGYGLLIEEVCKISIAYVLIVRFQQLFLGAILSLIAAAFIQIVYYVKLVWGDLRDKFRWSYVKEWLKGSIISIYYSIGNQIAAFVLILLFLYGGQAARADYQAAATFANIIGYSSYLALALYPRLLAQNNLEEITSSLKMMLMFALPMVAVAAAMSQSLLTILNIAYSEASPVLFILAIDTLVLLVSQFSVSVLLGVEKLDEEAKIPLKKLIKSKIFRAFTLPYIQAAITLPTEFYVLTQFSLMQPVQAAVYVTIINTIAHIGTFFATYAILRKSARFEVPWRNIEKYFSASMAIAILLYMLPRPSTIIWTFGTVAFGGSVYLALLLTIDKDARMLVASILQEIKNRF